MGTKLAKVTSKPPSRPTRWANRIMAGVCALSLAAGATILAVSNIGLLPPHPTTVNATLYVDPPPAAVAPVIGLDRVNPAQTVNAEQIRQGLTALGRPGAGALSYCVTDLNGQEIAATPGYVLKVPASSWKVLTAMAVLSAYGSNHRFPTTTVASSTGVVIVGGGDPYLTSYTPILNGHNRLDDLADQTVAGLQAAGRTTVTLGYDDTLFAGPGWNNHWTADLEPEVAPIAALSVDSRGSGMYSSTSLVAAREFANLLTARGITVTSIRAETAPSAATELGYVESATLGRIVHRVLQRSDNFASEILFRHVSVAAGGDGSNASARTALADYLVSRGVWTEGMTVSDGSGLSLSNRTTACALAAAIRAAFSDPTLGDVLAGLPVAGYSGTLADRFDDPSSFAARGVVRAKTGTHDHERTLTGYAQTTSGALVVFSFMFDQLGDHGGAVYWMDEAAALLARS